MKKRLAFWIATCGPLGHSRVAPGSLGSLIGLLLAVIVHQQPLAFVACLAVLFPLSVWSSYIVSHESGESDPHQVILDEVFGMMLSFLWVPLNWQTLVLGFIGFRVFDIVKPPPIRLLEHLPKGFGIVLDDLAAGLYTNLLLQILVRYDHL